MRKKPSEQVEAVGEALGARAEAARKKARIFNFIGIFNRYTPEL